MGRALGKIAQSKSAPRFGFSGIISHTKDHTNVISRSSRSTSKTVEGSASSYSWIQVFPGPNIHSRRKSMRPHSREHLLCALLVLGWAPSPFAAAQGEDLFDKPALDKQ